MSNEFKHDLEHAMLAWLIRELDPAPDDPDRPVAVVSWGSHGFLEASCDTCGPEWPETTITYRTAGGDLGDYVVDRDFGDFVSELAETDEKEES